MLNLTANEFMSRTALLEDALTVFYAGQCFDAKVDVAFELLGLGYPENVVAETVTRMSMLLAYQMEELSVDKLLDVANMVFGAQREAALDLI